MKTALILANGEPPSKKILSQYLKESNFFICADGGANIAAKYKLSCEGVPPTFHSGE